MYHIIINPVSRSGRGLQIWNKQVEPILREKKAEYRSYFSEKPGDVIRIVRELSARTQGDLSLLILGGDGTMNEALQGMEDPSRFILGYIPTGSSNDLARDLKIPKNPSEALELILNSESPRSMDLGTVVYPDGEMRHFAVSCGIGFDAAVCEEALHSKIKKTMNRLGLGKLTYLGIALRQLFAAKAVSGKAPPLISEICCSPPACFTVLRAGDSCSPPMQMPRTEFSTCAPWEIFRNP